MKTTPTSDMTATNDKELLGQAAKAAGYLVKPHPNRGICTDLFLIHESKNWNPLTDDGDALRLAVKLSLLDDPRFRHERDVLMFTKNMPKLEAHRRAFVVTAAEIGRAMT